MRILSYAAALAIILGTGVAHGLWTGRWSTPEDFRARLAALDRLPMRVGAWSGQDVPHEAKDLERAGVAGGIMRRYEDGRGGDVTVLLVCGRPGPTSVHTPEVCYAGAGFEPTSPRRLAEFPRPDGGADSFWAADFTKQSGAAPDYLRIYYAWSTDGPWRASDRPRLDFAGAPALYKLYVIRPLARPGAADGDAPVAAFLREFLPESDRSLRPAP